jgi:hypothetical protein
VGNLKNKWVKPGSAFNYTEAQRLKAAEDITTNDIVVITGVVGGIGIVRKADCLTARGCDGRVLIAKHDIPAQGYGVGLPWALLSQWDTGDGLGNAGSYGDLWLIGSDSAGLGGAGKMINANSTEGQAIITAAGLGNAVVRPIAKTITPSSADGVADGAIYMAVETPL